MYNRLERCIAFLRLAGCAAGCGSLYWGTCFESFVDVVRSPELEWDFAHLMASPCARAWHSLIYFSGKRWTCVPEMTTAVLVRFLGGFYIFVCFSLL